MTDQARLFNCCRDNAAPDWTAYTAIMIGGCIDHNGETEGLVSYSKAEFFTVYGINPHGEAEAITDVPTVSLINALSVAHELAALSGLRLTVCRFLFA